ncbi:hypothetical protein [Propionicicella superfundia]|uniref:hypothetical protein n=1 Tax=Propionicicella superfundia TaxID=348582 RepID=UPI00040A802D|nr:hypothetical protein [Propionicicella superfundia]
MAAPESEPITDDQSWRATRATSLAARLLSGAGSLALVAYRHDPVPVVDALAHGLSSSGELLVAGCPSAQSWEMGLADSTPVDVRADIMKGSSDPRAEVTASGMHLLGVFEWIPDDIASRMLARGEVPPRVAAVAASTGGRLGVVGADRVLLHDSYGVTPLAFSAVAASATGASARMPFPAPDEELDALDAVAGCGDEALMGLHTAVCEGTVRGDVLLRRAVPGACPHHDQILCVDVDRTGTLLMRVRHGVATTVFARFAEEATSAHELNEQCVSLIKDSALVNTPRI